MEIERIFSDLYARASSLVFWARQCLGVNRFILQDRDDLVRVLDFPSGLTEINIINCGSFEVLYDVFADDLPCLIVERCLRLQEIRSLPDSIALLSLADCINLQALPPMPRALVELNLYGCNSLQALPELPLELQALILTGCNHLHWTDALIAQLRSLEAAGCHIEYPDNAILEPGYIYPLRAFDQRCHALMTSDRSSSPTLSPRSAADHLLFQRSSMPLHTLFYRFITERTQERDHSLSLIATLEPLLLFFEQNPQHLTWAQEIAGQYLSGCINQPVQGVSVLAAWVHIAQAETISQKCNAARYLLAITYISYIVPPLMPGAGIEAEAANVLLSDLYAQSAVALDWPGIPNGIAYQSTVESWRMQKNVIVAKQQLKIYVETVTESEIASALCDPAHYMIWMDLTGASDFSQIKMLFQNKKEDWLLHEEIIETPCKRRVMLESLPPWERLVQFKYLENDLKHKNSAARLQYYADINHAEEDALRAGLLEWTRSALHPASDARARSVMRSSGKAH